MQDFEDPDEFVDRLVEIDQDLGGKLEEQVNFDQVIDAFVAKFGEEAVRKLAKRFNLNF